MYKAGTRARYRLHFQLVFYKDGWEEVRYLRARSESAARKEAQALWLEERKRTKFLSGPDKSPRSYISGPVLERVKRARIAGIVWTPRKKGE